MLTLFRPRSIGLALLLLSVLAVGTFGQSSPSAPTAFPIQRVPVTPTELPGLLKRLEAGTLTRLPMTEFDALLAAARTQTARKRAQPTLTEVRYRAKLLSDRLDENSLTGTAEWKIRRRPEHTSTLPLPGLQLAIRQAKWPDGQDAELYTRPGAGVFLEVPTTDDSTLNLEWSLRGIPEPGELRFTLDLVPAALASLDLELPATLTPFLLDEDALLSGPTPTEHGTHTWRINCGGSARLELVLRRSDAVLPLLFGRLNTTVRLQDIDGTARFEYRLDGASGGFTELQFDHDATVTPTGVTVNNLVSWASEDVGEAKKRLVVRLREPTRSASLIIAAAVSVPKAPTVWTSPTLVCRNSVLRSEQLHWITTDRTELLQWNGHGYRVVNAERLADGTYTIDYEPLPQPDAKTPAPKPAAVVQRRTTADVAALQTGTWTITPQEQLVHVSTRFTLRDGRLTTLAFRLPERWQLDRVEFANRDVNHELQPNNILQVTLPRPTLLREVFDVTVRLKRPTTPLADGETLPVPDVVPLGGRSRQGRFVVKVDPTWQATWSGLAGGPLQFSDAKQELDIPFESEGPSGRVRWEARSSRLHVEVHTDLTPPRLQTRLHVRVPRGSVGEQAVLPLWTPSPVAEPWGWRDPAGRFTAEAQRVPAKDIAARLRGFASTPTLATVPTQASAALSGYHWTLPLPKIPATEVQLETDYMGLANEPAPLVWVPNTDFVGHVQTGTHVTHYGRPSKTAPPTTVPLVAECAPASVTHTLNDDGLIHSRYVVRLRGWKPPTFPVQLPPQTTLRHVRIAGHTVRVPTDERLLLPLPQTNAWLDIELEYQHTAMSFRRLPSDVPTLPLPTPTVLHTWRISPRWLPLATNGWSTHLPQRTPLPLPDASPLLEPLRLLVLGQQVQSLTVANRVELLATLRRDYRQRNIILDERALAEPTVAGVLDAIVLDMGRSVLVTTPGEYRSWQTQAPLEATFVPVIERSLTDAKAHGRDATGRFVLLGDSDTPPEWTAFADVPSDWLVLEQRDPPTGPVLVDRSLVLLALWLLALLPVTLMAVCQHTRRRSVLLCSWFVLCVGVWLFGPEPWPSLSIIPLFGGLGAGVVQAWAMWRQPRLASKLTGRTTVSLKPAVGVAALLTLVVSVHAAETTTTVYVLSGSTPNVEMVAPTPFIERLKQAAALAQERPNVVLTRAKYQGTIDGNHAKFTAEFRVVVHDDLPTRITLPLGQVKLSEVLLDGGPAGTVEVKNSDLRIAVRGRGDHTLQLQFRTPLTTANGRELRFSIPEIPNAHLRFEVPQPSSRLRPVGWRGAVQVSSTPQSEVLDVDLGHASSIHLLWQPGGKESAPTFRVREVALWSLASAQALLRSAIEYRIDSGTLGELKVVVPGDCDIVSLDLRRETTTTAANTIRGWSLTPGGGSTRLLTVQLHAPLSSRAVLQLELVPTYRLAVRPTLRVPNVPNVEAESYVALAVDSSVTFADLSLTPLTPLDATTFGPNTWAPLWGQATEPITAAYRSTGKESTKLTGTLRLPPSVQGVAHQVDWGLEANRVLGTITSRWTATDKLVTFDWAIPAGFTLFELRAPGLQRWTQSGNRVRVWLDKPVPEVVVTWRLTQPLALNDGADVALPTPPGSGVMTCTAKLSAAHGLLFFTNPAEPLTQLAWTPKANDVQRVRVLPSVVQEVSSESTVDTQREGLLCQQRLQLQRLPNPRPQVVLVRFPLETPSDVTLAIPQGWTTKAQGTGPQRVWEVTIPPTQRPDDYLRVTTRVPYGSGDRWPMPTCELFTGQRRVPFRTSSLTVATKELVVERADGLELAAPNYYLAVSTDWRATLMRVGANARPKHIEAAGITATRLANEWYYRARYRLNITPGSDVRLDLPDRVQSVWINNETLPTVPTTLTLDNTATTLEFVWRDLELRPRSHAFTVAGETWQPPTTWDILMPPGTALAGTPFRTATPLELPTPNATGPEWVRGLPYRFTAPAGLLRVEAPPLQPLTLSQWLLVLAGVVFVLLNLTSNVHFAPEHLVCLGIAMLACCGTLGLPGLALVLLGLAWRVHITLRFLQRPPHAKVPPASVS